VQRCLSLAADCDGDAVLARVAPAGSACHTGSRSCFGEAALAADILATLDAVIAARASEAAHAEPAAAAAARAPWPASTAPSSYTRRLLGDRNLRMKKLGEELAELVAACAAREPDRAVE
jgi:phosphoribosyl-ATP pyrophosphohydrolase/phosphoribosyl-AMP cyclohydrolase